MRGARQARRNPRETNVILDKIENDPEIRNLSAWIRKVIGNDDVSGLLADARCGLADLDTVIGAYREGSS